MHLGYKYSSLAWATFFFLLRTQIIHTQTACEDSQRSHAFGPSPSSKSSFLFSQHLPYKYITVSTGRWRHALPRSWRIFSTWPLFHLNHTRFFIFLEWCAPLILKITSTRPRPSRFTADLLTLKCKAREIGGELIKEKFAPWTWHDCYFVALLLFERSLPLPSKLCPRCLFIIINLREQKKSSYSY